MMHQKIQTLNYVMIEQMKWKAREAKPIKIKFKKIRNSINSPFLFGSIAQLHAMLLEDRCCSFTFLNRRFKCLKVTVSYHQCSKRIVRCNNLLSIITLYHLTAVIHARQFIFVWSTVLFMLKEVLIMRASC